MRGYAVSRLRGNADPRIIGAHEEGRRKDLIGKRVSEVPHELNGKVLDGDVEVNLYLRSYGGKRRKDTDSFRVVAV